MDERRCTNVYNSGDERRFNPCDSFQYWGEFCSVGRQRMNCCDLSYCETCIRHRLNLGQDCYCRPTLPTENIIHTSKLHWFINNCNYRIFLLTNYSSVVLFFLSGEDLLSRLNGNINIHRNERIYAASHRFGKRFPIFICAARGYEKYWEDTLQLQIKMLHYFDGQSGLPLFALAAANDHETTEGM